MLSPYNVSLKMLLNALQIFKEVFLYLVLSHSPPPVPFVFAYSPTASQVFVISNFPLQAAFVGLLLLHEHLYANHSLKQHVGEVNVKYYR